MIQERRVSCKPVKKVFSSSIGDRIVAFLSDLNFNLQDIPIVFPVACETFWSRKAVCKFVRQFGLQIVNGNQFHINIFIFCYASSSFYLAFWTVKFYLWAFFLYLFIFVALQQKIKSRFIFFAGSSFVIGNYNGLWIIFHIKLTEVSYFFSMIFVVNWIEQKNWELSKFFDFPKML